MKKGPQTYTAFWNTMNELASPGNGTTLLHHHHEADEDSPDDYAWDGMALYSACMNYRYALTRVWDKGYPLFCAIMLNPSTATEYALDPTVFRVLERARQDTFYGGLLVMNVFAFRATDPKNMRAQTDPVGRENNRVIEALLPHTSKVMCGWGTHGEYRDRGKHVEALIRKMHIEPFVLELTKAGHPIHPLYQPYNKKLKPWPVEV